MCTCFCVNPIVTAAIVGWERNGEKLPYNYAGRIFISLQFRTTMVKTAYEYSVVCDILCISFATLCERSKMFEFNIFKLIQLITISSEIMTTCHDVYPSEKHIAMYGETVSQHK